MVVLVRLFSNSTPSPLGRAIRAYRKLDLGVPRQKRGRRLLSKRALRLNTTQLDRLVQRYEAGCTVYELANEFGLHRTTISKHLKGAGVTLRLSPPGAAEIDQMIGLYESGLSLLRVGERVGVDAATVQRHLSNLGIARRDTQGRPRK